MPSRLQKQILSLYQFFKQGYPTIPIFQKCKPVLIPTNLLKSIPDPMFYTKIFQLGTVPYTKIMKIDAYCSSWHVLVPKMYVEHPPSRQGSSVEPSRIYHRTKTGMYRYYDEVYQRESGTLKALKISGISCPSYSSSDYSKNPRIRT